MAGLDKRVATYHEALEGLTKEMTSKITGDSLFHDVRATVEFADFFPFGNGSTVTGGSKDNRVIQGQFEKRIEQRTLSRKGA